MRQSGLTEEQILNILRSVEMAQRVSDAYRTDGISEQPYHRWKITPQACPNFPLPYTIPCELRRKACAFGCNAVNYGL